MDRQPIEHVPDRWAGELDGLHIRHDGDPIPVTVHVTWTDGTEGEVNGWTSQWTKSHVCVVRDDGTALQAVLGARQRRKPTLTMYAGPHDRTGGQGGWGR